MWSPLNFAHYYILEQLKQQQQHQHIMDLMEGSRQFKPNSQLHGLSQPISSQTLYSQPASQCMEINRRVEEFNATTVLAQRDENAQFEENLENIENDILAQQLATVPSNGCSGNSYDCGVYRGPDIDIEMHTCDSKETNCEVEDPLQMIIIPEQGSNAVRFNIIARDREGNRCTIITNRGYGPNNGFNMNFVKKETSPKGLLMGRVEKEDGKEIESERKVKEETEDQADIMTVMRKEGAKKDRRTKVKFSRASAPRFRKTAQQVALLENAFKKVRFPPVALLDDLSKKTLLSAQQIRLWFQHKRNKSH